MISLVLNPVVLCVLVWLFARGTAEIEFGKMFFIALAVGIAGFVVALAVGGGIVGLAAQLPVMALLVFLLMKYCYVTVQQAAIVAALYYVYQVGFVFLMQALTA